MKLSKRLLSIIDKIPQGSKVADIGTDHGYIPVYLKLQGISNYIIASDNRIGSLNKAIKIIEEYNLSEFIFPRLGAGITVLKKGEVDTIIVAGMGGISIAEILDKGKEIQNTVKRFVFQPMKASDYLRKYLFKNEFKIIDEDLVKEQDKYYEVIVAEHGKEEIYDEIYFEVGKKLFEKRHCLLKDFIKYKINKLRKIKEKVFKSVNNEWKIKKTIDKIKKYEVLLHELEVSNNSRNDG
ncbi:SAM-dependent methyltransferase [Aceticella autotrophica]|uniref:SAM-dependent methyltransferase n=1 Tax=Aceticella autotrophica TaxID=2755338 RepID=A0A975AXI2_9THEO|nr:class I SAM-dependent methyltransferase [Aceticella autotrophica]QSZ28310.1 SAM-dependent methyltransferase [Aceticella autotrophica]